jgi:orotate phosphoribosyltransferase
MDETTKAIIERVSIRFPKPSRIPSGQICSVFFDCFQLTPSDHARLAADAVGHLDHDAFDIVVGIAYSGILYSAAVAGGRKVVILQKDGRFFGPDLRGQRVVIADDVVFSGRHIMEATEKVKAEGGNVVGYACIIDRSGGMFSGDNGGELGNPLWSAFQAGME